MTLVPEGWTIHRLGQLSNCRGGTSGWIADIFRPADAVIPFPSEGTAVERRARALHRRGADARRPARGSRRAVASAAPAPDTPRSRRAPSDLAWLRRFGAEPCVSDDALEILGRETAYQGFFRVDRFRLRHRLYAGGWTTPMEREIFERGRTVGLLLYDPAATRWCWSSSSAWRRISPGCRRGRSRSSPASSRQGRRRAQDVARREAREEAGLDDRRRARADPSLHAEPRRLDRSRRPLCAPRRCAQRRRHPRPRRRARGHQGPGADLSRGDAPAAQSGEIVNARPCSRSTGSPPTARACGAAARG